MERVDNKIEGKNKDIIEDFFARFNGSAGKLPLGVEFGEAAALAPTAASLIDVRFLGALS